MAEQGVVQRRTIAKRTTDAHKDMVQVDLTDLVIYLRENLGTRLVAEIAGATPRQVTRWADGDAIPRDVTERRLRTAYQVFRFLVQTEDKLIVRAWFLGMNPQLEDTSPTEGLAADRYREVLAAAQAFARGG